MLARFETLTEAFVKMGLPREIAEENACRIKHVVSEEAFSAIRKYFDMWRRNSRAYGNKTWKFAIV